MRKWFKKYRKMVMIVVGIVLMVAFLIGDTLRGIGDSGYRGGGMTVDGKAVAGLEVGRAGVKAGILKNKFPMMLTSMGIGLDEKGKADHWYLLAHEARRAGMIANEADGENFIDQIAPAMGQQQANRLAQAGKIQSMEQYNAESQFAERATRALALMAEGNGALQVRVPDAVAEGLGVQRYIQQYVQAPQMGADRLYERMGFLLNRAAYNFVWIPVDEKVASELPPPPDEELQKFFQTYRETPANKGEFGIGYLKEPRAKMQWLTIDKKVIQSQVKVRAADIERRLIEMGDQMKSMDAASKRSSAQKVLTDERTNEIMNEAQQIIKGEILKVTANLQDERIENSTFKRLPSDWDAVRPDLTAIGIATAKQINTKYNTKLPPFPVTNYSEWAELSTASRVPGIGRASLKRETGKAEFGDVIASLKEISGGRSPLAVQANVPLSEALTDAEGNAYYVNFTETRQQSGPDSMSEVRQAVLADYSRVKLYEKLAESTNELVAQASLDGMESFAKRKPANGAPGPIVSECFTARATAGQNRNRQTGQDGAPVMPQSKGQAFMLTIDDYANQVVSKAEALDPTIEIGEQPIDKRIFAIKAPKSRGVVIIQLIGYEPLTQERIEQEVSNSRSQGLGLLAQFAQGSSQAGVDNFMALSPANRPEAPDVPFTRKRLIERLKVTDLKTSDE